MRSRSSRPATISLNDAGEKADLVLAPQRPAAGEVAGEHAPHRRDQRLQRCGDAAGDHAADQQRADERRQRRCPATRCGSAGERPEGAVVRVLHQREERLAAAPRRSESGSRAARSPLPSPGTSSARTAAAGARASCARITPRVASGTASLRSAAGHDEAKTRERGERTTPPVPVVVVQLRARWRRRSPRRRAESRSGRGRTPARRRAARGRRRPRSTAAAGALGVDRRRERRPRHRASCRPRRVRRRVGEQRAGLVGDPEQVDADALAVVDRHRRERVGIVGRDGALEREVAGEQRSSRRAGARRARPSGARKTLPVTSNWRLEAALDPGADRRADHPQRRQQDGQDQERRRAGRSCVRRRRRAHQPLIRSSAAACRRPRARRRDVEREGQRRGAPRRPSTRLRVVVDRRLAALVPGHDRRTCPAAASRSVNAPLSSVMAKYGVGTTRITPDIQSWMLQPTLTAPAGRRAPAAPPRPCRAGSRRSWRARTSRRDGGSGRGWETTPRCRRRPAGRAARTAC